MKKTAKILLFMLLMLMLQACSVQEKMSPQIFFERLSKVNEQLAFDTSEQFFDGNEYVCFVSDENSNSFVFQISVNDSGNSEKISVTAEKTDEYVFNECVESIIKVYAPDDDAKKIIAALYSDINNNSKFRYCETQWHSYSAVIEKECRYFSVSSKKLVPESEVELSLKPNDKVDF